MIARVIVASIALAAAAPAAAGEYKIVVNASNPVASLSRSEVSSLFLKRATRFADGRLAEPVQLAGEGAVKVRFCEEVLGKTASAVKSYWNQLVFSGRDVPPVEKAHDREIVEFVRAHPGGIGVVSSSASEDGVKVVALRD